MVATMPRRRTLYGIVTILPRVRFRSSGSSTLPWRPAVAEDCDPPATRGDGALAIVSACQLPKSVNSRATHDGEGAVATANPQMPQSPNAIGNRKSKIVNSQIISSAHRVKYDTTHPFFRNEASIA